VSPEDIALFQQAIDTANSGLKLVAHQQFCTIYNHGNFEDVTLLYWLAFTTPNPHECQSTIDTIARLEPAHPKLQELRAYQARTWMPQSLHPHGYMSPILTCPYCHATGPTIIKTKIATGGWIWFAAFFLVFLCCMSVPVPVAQTASMEGMAFFFLLVGIIGLFVIKKRSYNCGYCGIALGDSAR
jgi:hypothetical protein